MEDIDPPREEPGAARAILRTLEHHHLLWDDEVLWQHQRMDAYAHATDQLVSSGLAYRCNCRRKDLAALGSRYPGTCRNRKRSAHLPHAVRLRIDPDREQAFEDDLLGPYGESVADSSGDFIIRRRDGLPAYQLAVAVDDAFQGITTVMRGADLLDSTPRQLYLLQTFELATPRYAHHPILTNEEGQKLSKQTHAPALNERAIAGNLNFALRFLGQREYHEGADDVEFLLKMATKNWRRGQIPRATSLYLPCP